MLIEGLYTAHAWWTSWGGMPLALRKSKLRPGTRPQFGEPAPRRRLLSGGVDSLHMLMRNRRLYRQDDLAYISDALFIHGFDIGKRLRDPRTSAFEQRC